jgi:ParB-like chromosome segregation protein Spo0J
MKNNDKKIEQVATASLVPYAKNAKKHDAAQVAAIAGSIREFGFNNPVLIDADNGIIAGHGRVLAAHQLGLESVPCLRLTHLSDTQKRAYILADNRLAELGGGWDAEMLAAELEALSAEGITMEEIGFDADALEELGATVEPEGKPEIDAEPQIDKAEELRDKWGVEPGQLWELGDHRLLCGDSTKKEDVARVMGGEKAGAVVTDPPYGIGIDGQRESICKNPKHNRKAHTFMGWDSERPAKSLFDGIIAMAAPTAIFGGNYFADLLPASRGWIYWSKGQDGLTMSDGELAWTNTEKPLRCVTVNRAALQGSQHPTQKPVAVIVFAINYIEPQSGPIFEPFSGSGTTLIACEQLGRKCRAIEISPAYVAVALQRWADATGKTPKLVA